MQLIIPKLSKQITPIEPDSTGTVPGDYILSKHIADLLMDVYPGYSWLIRANHQQGVVNIMCGEISSTVLSNRMPGMVVHIKNMADWKVASRLCIMQAGELLERANLKRGKWNGAFPNKVDGLRPHEQPNGGILWTNQPTR